MGGNSGESIFPDFPFPMQGFNEMMAEHHRAMQEHARIMSEVFSGSNHGNVDGDLALALSLSEEGNNGSDDRISSHPMQRQSSRIIDEDYALALSLSEEGNSRRRQRSRSRDRDAGGSRNRRRVGGGRGGGGRGDGGRGSRGRDSRGSTAGAPDTNAGVGDECTICMSTMEASSNRCELVCSGKHVYHDRCIKTWLRSNDTCPICRESVNGSNVIRASRS